MELTPTADFTRRTAHELVKTTLRQAILRGELEWGTRLIQADIAKQLGVSTTPVREALRDLVGEGVIAFDAHRGAVVKRLAYEEIQEIHEICRLLEPHAMRLLAEERQVVDLEAPTRLAEAMEEEHDIGAWCDLNRRFHGGLAPSSSPRLTSILNGLRDAMTPYTALSLTVHSGPEHIANANADHVELLAAIRSGDAERAANVSVKHLELTVRVLVESRELFWSREQTVAAARG